MNRKLACFATASILLAGCESLDTGFVALYAVTPDLTVDMTTGSISCEYDPNDPALAFARMDVFAESAFSLQIVAENRLADDLAPALDITPTRFDYRWECDSSGFTAGQGPLIVPAFDPNRPFCLDNRSEAQDFVGFDSVAASGQAIPSGEQGVIGVRIVPPQLAEGFRDTFEIGILADRCCRQINGCQNAQNATGTDPATPCGQLQAVFESLGTDYSVNNEADLETWRPFVIHTMSSGITTPTGATKVPAPYLMRVRGQFEGMTGSGTTVVSTEFSIDFGIGEGIIIPLSNQCLNF